MIRPQPRSPLFPFTPLFRSAPDLARLGLVLEGFGRGAVALREVPAALAGADGAALLRDGAEALGEDGDARSEEDTSEVQVRQYSGSRPLLEKKKIVTALFRC